MVYNSHQDLSCRSGADPAVVEFRDEYYMFAARSMAAGIPKIRSKHFKVKSLMLI